VQEYYYIDKLKFVCVVITRLEPSNYISGILFCFLVYVLYVFATMYVFICLCFHLGIWPSGYWIK